MTSHQVIRDLCLVRRMKSEKVQTFTDYRGVTARERERGCTAGGMTGTKTVLNTAGASLPPPISVLFHKLRLQFHRAKTVDFTIDVVIAFDQTNTFHFGANLQR